ncbi:hypothetical protein IIZ72_00185 [Candidatus Saccharibacteria bacterium]|nr:hypothetical protein [Candidatus Saccharibacteria bacterium]
MAKEIAISKRAKISEAQQYVLLSVLGAAIFLGAAISLTLHFIKVIQFNIEVISAEEASIASYSKAIKNIGICKSPKGSVYTSEELKNCNPGSIDAKEIPGTLRANILENMAANQALASVHKENDTSCVNPLNGKKYTYADMMSLYNSANTTEALITASALIRRCSALRVIPDALPTSKNEEALLASLNKIFVLSGLEPDSLNPTGNSEVSTFSESVNTLSVQLSVEANSAYTIKFLDNVERSIRDFRIERATISWGGNKLVLQAQAQAYYMIPSSLEETTQVIKGDENE